MMSAARLAQSRYQRVLRASGSVLVTSTQGKRPCTGGSGGISKLMVTCVGDKLTTVSDVITCLGMAISKQGP